MCKKVILVDLLQGKNLVRVKVNIYHTCIVCQNARIGAASSSIPIEDCSLPVQNNQHIGNNVVDEILLEVEKDDETVIMEEENQAATVEFEDEQVSRVV